MDMIHIEKEISVDDTYRDEDFSWTWYIKRRRFQLNIIHIEMKISVGYDTYRKGDFSWT